MEPALICGHHPLQAVLVMGVLSQEGMGKFQVAPLVEICECMWDHLGRSLLEFQILVKNCKHSSVRHAQLMGEVVDTGPPVAQNKLLAFLDLVISPFPMPGTMVLISQLASTTLEALEPVVNCAI